MRFISCKDSFRIMIALLAHYELKLEVKMAFLNGNFFHESLHGMTQRFCHEKKRTFKLTLVEIHLLGKTSLKTVLFEMGERTINFGF